MCGICHGLCVAASALHTVFHFFFQTENGPDRGRGWAAQKPTTTNKSTHKYKIYSNRIDVIKIVKCILVLSCNACALVSSQESAIAYCSNCLCCKCKRDQRNEIGHGSNEMENGKGKLHTKRSLQQDKMYSECHTHKHSNQIVMRVDQIRLVFVWVSAILALFCFFFLCWNTSLCIDVKCLRLSI